MRSAPVGGAVVLVAALLVLFLAGCGGGSETTASAPAATAAAPAPAEESQGSAAQAGTAVPEPETADDEAALYFTSGEQFEAVKRKLPSGADKVEAAAGELVAGPTKAERSRRVEVQTAIPEGTRVRRVEIEDGTARVEVTPEFLRGVPDRAGDRDADERSQVNARVAQMAVTLEQFPEVERTLVVAGGVPAGEPVSSQELQEPKSRPKRKERSRRKGGNSIRRLQRRLARLRYLPGSAIDGIDGYRTRQAVLAFQAWERLDRDGVVGPLTRAALREASPPRPKLEGPSRRMEVYREKGVLLLVKRGRTRRAIHVSAGAPGTETPRGRFEVFRKELNSWSVPFQTWLPYASYFFQGIAFHEYPDVPVYPASHGCVRVPAPEAKGVYGFARMGTAVSVR